MHGEVVGHREIAARAIRLLPIQPRSLSTPVPGNLCAQGIQKAAALTYGVHADPDRAGAGAARTMRTRPAGMQGLSPVAQSDADLRVVAGLREDARPIALVTDRHAAGRTGSDVVVVGRPAAHISRRGSGATCAFAVQVEHFGPRVRPVERVRVRVVDGQLIELVDVGSILGVIYKFVEDVRVRGRKRVRISRQADAGRRTCSRASSTAIQIGQRNRHAGVRAERQNRPVGVVIVNQQLLAVARPAVDIPGGSHVE